MEVYPAQNSYAIWTDALVRAADQNPELAAKLLKRALTSDKETANTLLQSISTANDKLNISA